MSENLNKINTTYGEILLATESGIKKISNVPMPPKYSCVVLKLALELEKFLREVEEHKLLLISREDISSIQSPEDKDLKFREEFYKFIAKECVIACGQITIPADSINDIQLSAIEIKNIQKFVNIV